MMLRLLVFAAAALGIGWALYKRQQGGGVRKEKKKLDVRIVLGERHGEPFVQSCPDRIVARRRDKVSWAITNNGNSTVKVMLAEFGEEPLEKRDHERVEVVPGRGSATMKDTVKGNAPFRLYHYGIWLNDKEAVDPEITIKDFADIEE